MSPSIPHKCVLCAAYTRVIIYFNDYSYLILVANEINLDDNNGVYLVFVDLGLGLYLVLWVFRSRGSQSSFKERRESGLRDYVIVWTSLRIPPNKSSK